MEIHISSMIVHTIPDHQQAVKAHIEQLPGVEIHGESDCGKLIVVLESHHETNITEIMDEISHLSHVLSTALVYHQIEQLDSESESL